MLTIPLRGHILRFIQRMEEHRFVAARLQWSSTAAQSASRVASLQTCLKPQNMTAQGIASIIIDA